eukprot:CAMPEP_0117447036 /NCGR_PEP_ID=MMETSP0759-20121206/6659_1 /TAXON_ID=63605 /ORGANISM="Percolomonas cosmopolitus, Strain WS" /LENGTH=475 /DNA_ID=CAMNT_0005239341 /DNA_START=8 /DNA_END=1435 /DNA_ORIENTATION=+
MPHSPLPSTRGQNFHHRSPSGSSHLHGSSSQHDLSSSHNNNESSSSSSSSNGTLQQNGAMNSRSMSTTSGGGGGGGMGSLLSSSNILSGGALNGASTHHSSKASSADYAPHSHHHHHHHHSRTDSSSSFSSNANDFPTSVQKTTNSALRAIDKLAAYERCLLIFTIMLGFLILQIILFGYYQKKFVDNQHVLHNGEIIHTLDSSWDHYWNGDEMTNNELVQHNDNSHSGHLHNTLFNFPHHYSGFQIEAEDYVYIINEVIVKPLQHRLREYDHVAEFGSGAGGVLCVLNQMLMRESTPSQCIYPLTKIEGSTRKVNGLHFFGVDFSAKMIGKARTYLPHVDFFRSDILKVDFLLDESIEHSIAFSVMHYLSSTQEIIDAIKNMIRITKTGGTIIVGELFECDKIPNLTAEDLRNVLPQLPNQFDHLMPSAVCISDLEEHIKPLVTEFSIVETSANARLASLHPRSKYVFSLRLQK